MPNDAKFAEVAALATQVQQVTQAQDRIGARGGRSGEVLGGACRSQHRSYTRIGMRT